MYWTPDVFYRVHTDHRMKMCKLITVVNLHNIQVASIAKVTGTCWSGRILVPNTRKIAVK